MKWFRDLKIASKFFAVVVVLLALQVFIGVFSMAQLSRVNATSTDIEVNWLPSVRLLAQIEVNTAEYRRFELQHVLSTTDADFEEYERQLAASAQTHEKLVAEYEKVITSEEERQIYRDYRAAWERYEGDDKKVVALDRKHQNVEGRDYSRGEGKAHYDTRGRPLAQGHRAQPEGRDRGQPPRRSDLRQLARDDLGVAGAVRAAGRGAGDGGGAHDPQWVAERARRHREARARRHERDASARSTATRSGSCWARCR